MSLPVHFPSSKILDRPGCVPEIRRVAHKASAELVETEIRNAVVQQHKAIVEVRNAVSTRMTRIERIATDFYFCFSGVNPYDPSHPCSLFDSLTPKLA